MCDSEAAIIETFQMKVEVAARETYDLFKDGPEAKAIKKAIKKGNWSDIQGTLVLHQEFASHEFLGVDEILEAAERNVEGLCVLAVRAAFSSNLMALAEDWEALLSASALLPGLEWPSGFKVD